MSSTTNPRPQPKLTTQYPTREVLVLTAPDFVPMSILQILQAAGIDIAALPRPAPAPASAALETKK